MLQSVDVGVQARERLHEAIRSIKNTTVESEYCNETFTKNVKATVWNASSVKSLRISI